MKDDFYGYYPPDESEINEIWDDSIIALDANTLLNLYRYTKSTKDDFLKVLSEYSERLWLPYQAGYEFHSNRISVIKSQEYAYKDIGKELDDCLSFVSDKLNNYKRHPFIKTNILTKQVSDKFEKIKSDLEKLSEKHPEYLKNDDILPKVTELFDGRVGNKYSDSELDAIYEEGEKRYEKNIPPGFSDRANKKKKGNRHLYGDLIIWKQLIKHSKDSKKTIIFITDDRKEDWWLKFKGETIRPREELIKEFYDETGYRILIYQADMFLYFANEKLEKAIKDKSIKEVKEVRLEDESKYVSLYNLQSDYGINNNDLLSYNKNDGIYINPLSGSTMDILKNTSNIFSAIETTPSWMKNIDSISKIAEQSSWMKDIEASCKLFETPSWLDKVNSLSKLTQNPSWMEGIDRISKLTASPDWLDKLNANPYLNINRDENEDDK